MHDYIYDPELVRLAIMLGIITSMLIYNRYGVTAGGVVVPGYLALFVLSPTHIAATFFIALLTFWVVQGYLRPRLMLWGRRLFENEILVALSFQILWIGLLFLLTPFIPQVAFLYGIGFLIPGIIAHDMGRQGVRTTIGTASISMLIVFGLIVIIGAFRDILGLSFSFLDTAQRSQVPDYAYPIEWILIGITVSVLVSIALYHQGLFPRSMLTHSLRAGGFVTAGYLALFINQPEDLLFITICSGLTYIVVTKFLMKQAILFGRSKMAVMFLTGMAITWAAEIIVFISGIEYIPWIGFTAITPTIVALLANDAERQGPKRTIIGVVAATVIVFVTVNVLFSAYKLLTISSHSLALIK